MVIDGRKLAAEIINRLKKVSLREISCREKISKLPRLTIGAVLAGEDPASISFLKQKAKIAEALNINFRIFQLKSRVKTDELIKEIGNLNRTKNINGIIVQLPLPRHIKTEQVLGAINPKKDIDALSLKPSVLAPTVESVKYIFKKYKITLKNKNILIVGHGHLVGRPIYNWLSLKTNKITIIDIKQKNQLPKLARKADIIISGVGKSGLIKGNIIKKGAILIDFGFSRKNSSSGGEARKIYGDFDFTSCAKKAELITPVPGGMGPIMVAMLFKNLFKLIKM